MKRTQCSLRIEAMTSHGDKHMTGDMTEEMGNFPAVSRLWKDCHISAFRIRSGGGQFLTGGDLPGLNGINRGQVAMGSSEVHNLSVS